MLSTIFLTFPVKAEGAATIRTDKSDYSPEEVVTIFGSGFNPYFDITVNVERPDGIIDTVYAKADEYGSFTAYYVLDGITGTYIVTASDGINTATTTFTDADIEYVSVSPDTRTITAGDSTTYTVTVAKKGGSTLSVTLSIVGSLPSGATYSFSPNPVTFSSDESGTKTSTLTITTYVSGSTGTFTFKVRGTKTGTGDTADSSDVKLIVQSPPTQVYDVTFTESGLPAGTEWSVTFNSITKSSTTNTITFTNIPAEIYSWSVSTPISGGTGTRYVASPSSGTMEVPFQTSQSITYTTQYYLTVNTNPAGIDSPTGAGWYDAGATAHVATAQYEDIVSGSSRYRFDSWTGASGTHADATVIMDAAKTATANYVTQYYVTFAQSGVGSDFTGTVMTVGGVDYDRNGHSDWYDSGASISFSYSSPLVVTMNSKQYVLTGVDATSPLTVSGPTTVTGSYKTQYYLTVQSAYGTTGGSGWYDAGTNGYATVTPLTVAGPAGTQFVFTHWSGDASGTTSPSDAIVMNGPKIAVANWKTQYLVTFGWSGLDIDASGTIVTITVGGSPVVKNAGDSFYSEWLDAGTTLSYSFETIVSSTEPSKAYKLVSVAGTSTSASYDFGPISGPISETGNYGSIILSITKKAPSAVFVGDTIRYIYEVTNTGTTSATGITVTDGSLTVTFVGGDVDGDNKLDPKETWVYTATYGPVLASNMPSITNTAQVSCSEEAVAESTATVSVYQLEVSKTAETSYKRTYTWSISKTANPSILIFSSGTETSTVDYSIVLSATYEDSDWKVTGTITIYNPAPIDAVITDIEDIVSLDIVADIDFESAGVTFPYTLKAGQTLELTYSADLPDATSRTNTVTVTIQNYERPFLWDLTGDWVIRVHYGGTYDHDFSLTMDSDGLAFTGTGGYPASGPPYSITETITGVTAVNDVFWHSVYNNGYFWDAKGTIASDGTMSGIWTSSAAQAGTWESTSGSATLVKLETVTSDLEASANVDFGSATITEVDESVTVTDTYSGGPQGETVNYADAPKTFTYDRTIGPYANIGIYTVENTAKFVTCDTKTEGSDDCTVTVYRIGSAVTTSSFYLFDYDTADGRQFKLILTPDVPTNPNLYRVTATNPGQFFYNIFYYGGVSEPFVITIPDPFVTQGANPVHIYDSISTSGDYLLPAGNDITSQFIIEWSTDGRTCTITPINGYSGPVYITIHLDYGYKKTLGGLSKDSNNAVGTVTICDLTPYEFSVSGPLTDFDIIQNRNVFKRDPGFVGLVTDSEGNPIANVKVQIYGPDGKLLATVYTDKDGWYFFNYKYTGKAATFTIKLPEYNLQQSVTLKANSFVVVNFQIT